jgi:hypothetical protein
VEEFSDIAPPLPLDTPTRVYAGIGSRETPPTILALMRGIARELAVRGFVLRSGGAHGADSAFEAGAGAACEIVLPWHGFNGRRGPTAHVLDPLDGRVRAIAAEHHPAWRRLSAASAKLITRNTFQVLGRSLDAPSAFVLCWTKEAAGGGGTGQALRIARAYGVPVFDLARDDLAAVVAAQLRLVSAL